MAATTGTSTEFFGRSPHEPASGRRNISGSLAALAAVATPEPEHEMEAWHPDVPKAASTSFVVQVEEELEKNNPGVLAWLTSTGGVFFQMCLITFYVLLETVNVRLMSHTFKPGNNPEYVPIPSTFVVMNSGLSILLGLSVPLGRAVFSERGNLGAAICNVFSTTFQCHAIFNFAACSGLFSMSGIFGFMAYSKLDAGLKKILDQLRLPLTAALSTIMFGKKYTSHECMALGIMFLGVVSFYYADLDLSEHTEVHRMCRYPDHCFTEPSFDMCAIRVDGTTISGAMVNDSRSPGNTTHDISTFPLKSSKTEFTGLIFSLVSTLFNVFGSLFSEKLLKRSGGATPFPQQKAQMETTGFPVAIAMSFLVPLYIDNQNGRAIWWAKNEAKGSGAGFFQGYTTLTWVAFSTDIMMAWMSGIIVKQFSALVKNISKCFVLLLTVFSTGTIFKVCHADPLPLTMYCLAFVIVFSTVLFATVPKAQLAPVGPPGVPSRGQTPESEVDLALQGHSWRRVSTP